MSKAYGGAVIRGLHQSNGCQHARSIVFICDDDFRTQQIQQLSTVHSKILVLCREQIMEKFSVHFSTYSL